MKKRIVAIALGLLLAAGGTTAFAAEATPKICNPTDCVVRVSCQEKGNCLFGGKSAASAAAKRGQAVKNGSGKAQVKNAQVNCPNADCPKPGTCTGTCEYDGSGPKDGTGKRQGNAQSGKAQNGGDNQGQGARLRDGSGSGGTCTTPGTGVNCNGSGRGNGRGNGRGC